jgi:hypothetical protein
MVHILELKLNLKLIDVIIQITMFCVRVMLSIFVKIDFRLFLKIDLIFLRLLKFVI